MNAIDTLKAWILDSGIQNDSGSIQVSGGFNSWYSLKNQDYPDIYSEITGYGITTLLYLNSISADVRLITKARAAADWLINNALDKSGGILTRKFYIPEMSKEAYSFERGRIFTFDSGMVLFGISNLFKITGDNKYLQSSRKIADFLLSLQKKDGTIYATYELQSKIRIDDSEKWSEQSGAFHIKVAMGLLSTYSISNENKYKEAAISLCNTYALFQKNNGRFITNRKNYSTLQHPHCYALEGLLFCGIQLENQKYIDAAVKAIEWSFGFQNSNGEMPQIMIANSPVSFEKTDVLSQVLRSGSYLLTRLKGISGIISDQKLEYLYDRLKKNQNKEGRQTGGILYGNEKHGAEYKDVNSWCSMFALQAMIFYESFQKNQSIRLDFLI